MHNFAKSERFTFGYERGQYLPIQDLAFLSEYKIGHLGGNLRLSNKLLAIVGGKVFLWQYLILKHPLIGACFDFLIYLKNWNYCLLIKRYYEVKDPDPIRIFDFIVTLEHKANV